MKKDKNSYELRAFYKRFYNSLFFSYFVNQLEFEGFTREEERFLLSQFWEEGSVAIYPFKEDKSQVLICNYAPNRFGRYNNVVTLNLVAFNDTDNTTPHETLENNKDVVVVYAHVSHTSIRKMLEKYIDELIEIEICKKVNIDNLKLTRLIKCSVEDKPRLLQLLNRIYAGESASVIDAYDLTALENILNPAPYIVDKLEIEKQNIISNALTFLGVDNVNYEKKERLIKDEVNSNNQIIYQSGNAFIDEIEKGFKVLNELGFKCSVRAKNNVIMLEDDMNEKGANEDDNNI